MAVDKLVDSTELDNGLTTIADAIRTKGGTSALLAFPDGMAQAVADIPTGITPTGNINITDTNVTDVTNYATAQVVDADLIASNIKEGVNILGVLGTFAGGGGGSLPSSISKLDGGSFTLASDAIVNTYKISHSLGIVPKGFMIWTDDLDFSMSEATRYLTQMLAGSGSFGTAATKGVYSTLAKTENATNTLRDYIAQISGTNYSNTFSSTNIGCILTSMSYKAGATYNWLAWV